MAAYDTIHQYVVFDAEQLLTADLAQQPLSVSTIARGLRELLQRTEVDLSEHDYKIDRVPLVTFYPENEMPAPRWTPQEVFGLTSSNHAAAHRTRRAIATLTGPGRALRSIGADPTITIADPHVPTFSEGALFGTLDDARRLIRADQLPLVLDGNKVNVVVIDSGIDKSIVPAGQFGGGWQPIIYDPGVAPPALPGMTTGPDALHGMMIVQDILAMAPKARIFDVPLIPPPKIYNLPLFLLGAEATYAKILADIAFYQGLGLFPGPWVFVNAWAVYDRRSEDPFIGDYTENLGVNGNGVPSHPFITRIETAAANNFDLVFCAGNGGEVVPDERCGPNDYGPGRSIWGANAHKDVLTAGGVRVDGIWPGYSSEGPGPTAHLSEYKPDVCAPTQFVGTAGLYPPSTGTSASTAVAAGVVCALRSRANWNQAVVSPSELIATLNTSAVKTLGIVWNPWLGNGILDAGAAYQALLIAHP